MEELIQEYYANGALKLHRTVDNILRKIGGLSDKDKDDFYSAAGWAIAESWKKNDYDESKGSKEGYLYRIINFAVLSEIRDRNRFRRSNTRPRRDKSGKIVLNKIGKPEYEFIPDISIDAPLVNDVGTTIGDMIPSDFDVFSAIFGEFKTSKFEKYMDALPQKSRLVVRLIMREYKPIEIREILHITERQYSDAMFCIKSPQYISILY